MPEFGMLATLSVMTLLMILLLALWTIFWKGYALWIAAKENKKWWFIALLIVNTFGILEIIFIYFFSETGKKCIADWKSKRTSQKSSTEQPIESTQSETRAEKSEVIDEDSTSSER